MTTALHHAVQEARDGQNDTAVARVPSGWVLMGDAQTLPGYCLLVADPLVVHLHELAAAALPLPASPAPGDSPTTGPPDCPADRC